MMDHILLKCKCVTFVNIRKERNKSIPSLKNSNIFKEFLKIICLGC